jgi:hypothetical protein
MFSNSFFFFCFFFFQPAMDGVVQALSECPGGSGLADQLAGGRKVCGCMAMHRVLERLGKRCGRCGDEWVGVVKVNSTSSLSTSSSAALGHERRPLEDQRLDLRLDRHCVLK